MKRLRKSMSPVELLRLIQFLQIIGRHIEKESYQIEMDNFPIELSHITGLFNLGSMKPERTRSILREIALCGLCCMEEARVEVSSLYLANWHIFSQSIDYDIQNKNQRWNRLDGFLSEKHDLYKRFAELCDGNLDDERSDLEDVLNRFFPKPTVSTLVEWGYRLNRIQCNLLNGSFYPIKKEFALDRKNSGAFIRSLLDSYREEMDKSGQETVSLPVVAEKTCARLKIDRADFCNRLENFYDEYRPLVWLGAGVIRTYAYENFVSEEQSVLDVSGSGPWFTRDFFYRKTDLPQYAVDGIPRRFVKIERQLQKEVVKQYANEN